MTAPVVHTARLVLRPHRLSDFDACVAMWAHPDVVRFIGGEPSSREQTWSRFLRYTGHWALMGYGSWAVERKEDGRFIGEAGFFEGRRTMTPSIEGCPEAGWAFVPEVAGRGIATEVLNAAAGWVDRHHGWSRTVAMISPGNVASQRVAQKCGFNKFSESTYQGSPQWLFERTRRV